MLRATSTHDRAVESHKAPVRVKVEHSFLIVKRDFGVTKTRYRGIATNLNHVHVLVMLSLSSAPTSPAR